ARFKYAYRRTEARLLRAERTATVIARGLSLPSAEHSLRAAWDAVLFNAFHDILPGTAIERAYGDQLDQIGGASDEARRCEARALTLLASRIDTTAGAWPTDENEPTPQPVLVWNPHPWPLRTQVEIEAKLDYRPIPMAEAEKAAVPL